jgi:hypothetical protein
MSLASALEQLDAELIELEGDALGTAALALSARLAAIAARLAVRPARRWLSAERAAEVASVEVRDLHRWAKRPGATWATWPTRRTLLVDAEAFDRWLASHRFRRGRQDHEAEPTRTKPALHGPEPRTKPAIRARTGAQGG